MATFTKQQNIAVTESLENLK